ncbi:MAG: hypothetical protein ABI889_04705, partial [Gemmatimonadota bacterium]
RRIFESGRYRHGAGIEGQLLVRRIGHASVVAAFTSPFCIVNSHLLAGRTQSRTSEISFMRVLPKSPVGPSR